MNAQHTPIKGLLRVADEPYPHLRDDDGAIIARDYEDPKKTAYVVRACNSHAALVAALEEIADLDAHDSSEGFNEWGEAQKFHEAQKLARAALAQAGEGA